MMFSSRRMPRPAPCRQRHNNRFTPSLFSDGLTINEISEI
ncbi:hypothetical protein NEIELOOT_00440 [Neisseria elongata subsp. glycolytica ATCC 29315]|uniref:Uncharacterized protein n=1 Tax=Neisseria elongata subsp. glycolytica ATCC 29315 TaxID=546263 RepID=D4DN16_NEIEG|nr:hypothetical protein NEIELOOT_00440 [Neisseria elongata subsp. glycolytica ATCC 29315]